jgi:hypothetical protein
MKPGHQGITIRHHDVGQNLYEVCGVVIELFDGRDQVAEH